MSAYLDVSLRNDMQSIRWFTVVDNVSGQTVLDDNLDDGEVRAVKIAANMSREGDISYTARNSITIRKFGIEDGDSIDMN